MTSTFDDKVYSIIKTSGGLKGEQLTRYVNDEMFPVGSKIRDTSPNIQFSQGKWVLTGVYGTKEVILKESATQPFPVTFYFECDGSCVRATIKDLYPIGYKSVTLDFGTYLGSCKIKQMVGQAFNVSNVYKLWDNDKGQIEVTINGTTATISGESLNTNRMHEMTFLCNIVAFDTILDTFKNDNMTWEYMRQA